MVVKLYSVANTAGFGRYIAAHSEDEAVDIAMSVGHVRKRESAKVMELRPGTEITEVGMKRGIREILAGDETGTVVLVSRLLGVRPRRREAKWVLNYRAEG